MRQTVRLLRSVAIGGETLLLGWLVATEGLSGVSFLVLGILGVVFVAVLSAISWPFGAVLLLTASSAMPRFAGTVLGLHLRPEHVAVAFVCDLLPGCAL